MPVLLVMALFASDDLLAQGRLVLDGATLVDAARNDYVAPLRIVIAGGRFVCVAEPDACPSAPGDSTLDLRGHWITAGLIDAHVHLDYEALPERTAQGQALRFALGITTVRDAGSLQIEALLRERELALDAAHPSPRIVAAERPTAPYDTRFGVPLGAPLVEQLARIGVDQIKIKDNVWNDSIMLEEIRTAERLGLSSYGHTWRGPPPKSVTSLAVAAGLDGVSHLEGLSPAAQPPTVDLSAAPPEDSPDFVPWRKGLWVTADPARLAGLSQELIANAVWLEPLLVTEYYWAQPLHPPPSLSFLRTAPPSLRDVLLGRDELTEPTSPRFPEPYRAMAAFVRAFAADGGLVIAGSDDVRPGLDLHAEIRLLREAGLTPFEALRAATTSAARALGREDIGAVQEGRLADAVVFTEDPLAEPGATLNVRYVIKGGHVHDAWALLEPNRDRYSVMVREAWLARALRLLRLAVAVAGAGAIVWLILRDVQRRARAA